MRYDMSSRERMLAAIRCEEVDHIPLGQIFHSIEDFLIAMIHQREAALFGMSSIAMRTCRNADLRMGETVLIVGAGVIGQMAAQIATVMGARLRGYGVIGDCTWKPLCLMGMKATQNST